MKSKFVYREGKRYRVSAEVAGKELDRIRRQPGGLQARAVVDASASEEAPLHAIFEWENGKAADEYRLIQARNLIRSVQAIGDDEVARSVYIHVPRLTVGEGNYQRADTLAEHVDAFTLAMAEALKNLSAAQARVNELSRLSDGSPDRVAVIALAAQALATAERAIRSIN